MVKDPIKSDLYDFILHKFPFKPTEEQAEAVSLWCDFLLSTNRDEICLLRGYAGTGKSTLVKFIVAALNIDEDDVAYIAYTGKPSQVLKSKGCKNAITAHKLLYYANKNKDGEFIFRPRERLAHPY